MDEEDDKTGNAGPDTNTVKTTEGDLALDDDLIGGIAGILEADGIQIKDTKAAAPDGTKTGGEGAEAGSVDDGTKTGGEGGKAGSVDGGTKPEDNPDEDLKNLEDADGKKLSPELQEKISKRIGKVVGQRKELEEKLQKIETEKAELEAQVRDGNEKRPISTQGVHPMLLVDEPTKLKTYEKYLSDVESYCLENWDGYHGTGDDDPSYTDKEIRSRYAQVRKERENILPAAQARLQKMQQYDAGAVKTSYPELSDTKSKEYQVMSAILRVVPALKMLPNHKLIIGDMIQGEKVRKEKSAAATVKDPQPAPPPKLPSTTSPAAKSPLTSSTKKTKDIDVGAAARAGGGREALMDAAGVIADDILS